MRLAHILTALALAAHAAAQQTKPGDLVPIEQGTVDTSATQTTLRVMPVELSESTNFLRLYGVAGRPDLLVRSHGGTYAVFDQGQYVSWKGRVLPAWPSGTQFFIGRPDFTRVRSPGIRMGESNMLAAPGIGVANHVTGADLERTRAPDTRPALPGDARVADQRIGEHPVDNRVGAPPANARHARHAASPERPAAEPAQEPEPAREGQPPAPAPDAPAPAEPPRPATTP